MSVNKTQFDSKILPFWVVTNFLIFFIDYAVAFRDDGSFSFSRIIMVDHVITTVYTITVIKLISLATGIYLVQKIVYLST